MDVLRFIALLGLVNLAPILTTRFFPGLLPAPLDAGRVLGDGAPLLGPSKTWRGLLSALFAGTVCGLVLGYPLWVGLSTAALSMTGDMTSSFLKRRLGIVPSGMALGLDQIPESLLPALVLAGPLGFGLSDVVWVVAIFFIAELIASRVLFYWHVRRRPY